MRADPAGGVSKDVANPPLWPAIQRDITRRKKAEAEREALLAESRQYARKLAILQNITAATNAARTLLECIPTIAEQLRSFLPVDILTLSTYTPGEAEFSLYAVGAETEAGHFAPRGTRLPVEGTCPGWAITHNDVWLDDDMRKNIIFLEDEQLISEGVIARLVMPLRLGEEVIGTLNLASKEAGAFTEEDLPFLWQVADQLASALERSRFFEEAQRRARRERTIRQITEKLRAATSLDELARLTAEQLSEHLAADYALLELGIEGEESTN
ncbi:MAG: GAF domain-containing protein [Caldilineae bacterium]|nr:MAG: GAF domain-containing protein [Caldilineae bacterium]